AQVTVLFDTPRALKGRMVRDLKLNFVKGKVVEFHAKKFEEVFREVLEATKGDKENIAQFAIGLNPKVELIGYATDELALGTATIGIGANRGIGGRNDSSFSFSGTIAKPTIEIDGYAIMTDGKITL
ncbi:MAG: aminopeptidase, partial [Thermoproteota archaeon]